jgi:hypothetical protein
MKLAQNLAQNANRPMRPNELVLHPSRLAHGTAAWGCENRMFFAWRDS